MTDYSQLVKRLREDVFYGDERLRKMHLHNPLHMEAADAIDALQVDAYRSEIHRNDLYDKIVNQRTEISALQARVAELEAGLREQKEQLCEGFCQDLPAAGTYSPEMDFHCGGCKARALIERKS